MVSRYRRASILSNGLSTFPTDFRNPERPRRCAVFCPGLPRIPAGGGGPSKWVERWPRWRDLYHPFLFDPLVVVPGRGLRRRDSMTYLVARLGDAIKSSWSSWLSSSPSLSSSIIRAQLRRGNKKAYCYQIARPAKGALALASLDIIRRRWRLMILTGSSFLRPLSFLGSSRFAWLG